MSDYFYRKLEQGNKRNKEKMKSLVKLSKSKWLSEEDKQITQLWILQRKTIRNCVNKQQGVFGSYVVCPDLITDTPKSKNKLVEYHNPRLCCNSHYWCIHDPEADYSQPLSSTRWYCSKKGI